MPDQAKASDTDLGEVISNATGRGDQNGSNGVAEQPNANFNKTNGQENGSNESDLEAEDFSKLRCSSVQTEEISARRRRKTSGYPGLDFGNSIFSSGTIMKFRVISNELHNIQNVQLKRAEGEVAALHKRIQILGENLEKSEEKLRLATQQLDGVSQAFDKDERTSIGIQQQLLEKYLALIPDMQTLVNCDGQDSHGNC